MTRHVFAALAALALAACAPDPQTRSPDPAPTIPQAPPVATPASLPVVEKGWQYMDASALSEAPEDADDICMEWCTEDTCIQMCVDDALVAGGPAYASGAEGCTVCGRETGFRPEVEVSLDGLQARLSWAALPGATEYAIHVLRWSVEEDGEVPEDADDLRRASRLARKVIHTDEHHVALTLQPEQHYVVLVVGLGEDGEWISAPSEPIQLRL